MAAPAVPDDGAKLAAGLGRWLATFVVWFRRILALSGLAVALSGLAAVALAIIAWRDTPVLLVLCGLTGIWALAMAWISRGRVRPLLAAAAHPDELTAQAQGLFTRVRSDGAVGDLLRGAIASGGDGTIRVGLRGAWRLGRLASAVIEEVGPDPAREPLLVGLTPAALKGTWFRFTLTVWAGAVAAAAAWLCVFALILRSVA